MGTASARASYLAAAIGVIVPDEPLREAALAVLGSAGRKAAGWSTLPRDLPPLDVAVLGGGTPSRLASPVEELKKLAPSTRLIAIASPAPPREIRLAVYAGADGVVWESSLAALPPTVDSVLADQISVPQEFRRWVQRPELTTRERQVLGMIVLGLSNAEIAQKLTVTEATVKSHVQASFRKLGVRSRAQATSMIMDPREGLGVGILSITGGVN